MVYVADGNSLDESGRVFAEELSGVGKADVKGQPSVSISILTNDH